MSLHAEKSQDAAGRNQLVEYNISYLFEDKGPGVARLKWYLLGAGPPSRTYHISSFQHPGSASFLVQSGLMNLVLLITLLLPLGFKSQSSLLIYIEG